MNPNIIFKELDDIENVLINIKTEENEEAIDYCLKHLDLVKRYLL